MSDKDPANTQRSNNVAAASRYSDAVTTLLLRCVFAGETNYLMCVCVCVCVCVCY